MSTQPDEPLATRTGSAAFLETVIVPRTRDLGGFEVRRALPSAQRRMIGPFVFWDQMGPARFAPGQGIDVRPHPHIGLATVTYLFEGSILHRDNIGSVQRIEPGEINWMTAGRGIAHSERTDQQTRATGGPLAGIQSWIALPLQFEETVPSFSHHDRDSLPTVEGEGKRAKLLVGTLFGVRSPVKTFSDMFYADVQLEPGARLPVSPEHIERGVYIVDGAIEIAGDRFGPSQLLVLRPGDEIMIDTDAGTRILLFGGEPMDGPRHVWWNFVSSSPDRIEAAKADWVAGRFSPVPGDDEFIPLPE